MPGLNPVSMERGLFILITGAGPQGPVTNSVLTVQILNVNKGNSDKINVKTH